MEPKTPHHPRGLKREVGLEVRRIVLADVNWVHHYVWRLSVKTTETIIKVFLSIRPPRPPCMRAAARASCKRRVANIAQGNKKGERDREVEFSDIRPPSPRRRVQTSRSNRANTFPSQNMDPSMPSCHAYPQPQKAVYIHWYLFMIHQQIHTDACASAPSAPGPFPLYLAVRP